MCSAQIETKVEQGFTLNQFSAVMRSSRYLKLLAATVFNHP